MGADLFGLGWGRFDGFRHGVLLQEALANRGAEQIQHLDGGQHPGRDGAMTAEPILQHAGRDAEDGGKLRMGEPGFFHLAAEKARRQFRRVFIRNVPVGLRGRLLLQGAGGRRDGRGGAGTATGGNSGFQRFE